MKTHFLRWLVLTVIALVGSAVTAYASGLISINGIKFDQLIRSNDRQMFNDGRRTNPPLGVYCSAASETHHGSLWRKSKTSARSTPLRSPASDRQV